MIDFLKRFFLKKPSRRGFSRETIEIKALPEFDPDTSFNAFVTLSILLRERGEFGKAIELLERLSREDLSLKERKTLLLNLIITYRRAGFIDRAERQALEALKAFPDEPLIYRELAELKQLYGDWEASVNFLEKACELSSDFEEELTNSKLFLANIYVDRGQLDRALKLLKSIKVNFPLPFFYYTLSRIYFVIGESEKGISNAVTGMKVSANQIPVFLDLISGFVDVSSDLLRELISRVGENYPLIMSMVERLVGEERLEEALRWINRAVSLYPEDPFLREYQLKVMWKLGMRKQVAEEIEAFLECLKMAAKQFRCANCGYETASFSWLCPRCRSWETMELTVGKERIP